MIRKLFFPMSFLLFVAFFLAACEKNTDPSDENDGNDSTANKKRYCYFNHHSFSDV
ncbi:MAG: hypothetical protein IPH84_00665 [Bacteroidales bacterium]|nr:hypothetical protein [Bacteroidales bacterium]